MFDFMPSPYKILVNKSFSVSYCTQAMLHLPKAFCKLWVGIGALHSSLLNVWLIFIPNNLFYMTFRVDKNYEK